MKSNSSTLHTLKATKNVLILGASGTAGRAAVNALIHEGHNVTCLLRQSHYTCDTGEIKNVLQLPEAVTLRFGNFEKPQAFFKDAFSEHTFDVLLSCLASSTGVKSEAWAIDYQVHSIALQEAKYVGIEHMVLLSAICVQKPLLEFQHAKLAFEKELINSGLTYSIVRPTAFFKSLSGQIERVRNGKPYLVFGDGKLTSCKPISDSDLGQYMAMCIEDSTLHNKVLPIGGPGPAITPREQGDWLFELTGQAPKFRSVPVAIFDVAAMLLSVLSKLSKRFEAKAELARIGRYYATESMLVFDQKTKQYDANATPSTGTDTLKAFYKAVLDGTATVSSGKHAVFTKPSANIKSANKQTTGK